MVLKTVPPHDIEALCAMCNTTLNVLAKETCIERGALREFAAGRLALSAADRLVLIATLLFHDAQTAPDAHDPLGAIIDRVGAAWNNRRLISAVRQLLTEVNAESEVQENGAENAQVH
jgi:hypothetical protein